MMSQKETIRRVLSYIRRYTFFLICSLVLAAVTVALTLYIMEDRWRSGGDHGSTVDYECVQ